MDAPTPPAPDFRIELIIRVRREILDGSYDSAAKLEAALERLLTRFFDE